MWEASKSIIRETIAISGIYDGNRIILQAIPMIEPHQYEGGPLFAEIGPISIEQNVWNRVKKAIEEGAHFPCKILHSAAPGVSEKIQDAKLFISGLKKIFGIRTQVDGPELLEESMNGADFKFLVERNGKPHEFCILKDNQPFMLLSTADYNDRDVVVLALRTLFKMRDEDLSEGLDKKDCVKLTAQIQQLEWSLGRLNDDKEALEMKIASLQERLDFSVKEEEEKTKKMAELVQRDARSLEIANSAQEKIDKIGREKQFYLDVSPSIDSHLEKVRRKFKRNRNCRFRSKKTKDSVKNSSNSKKHSV